MPQNKASMAQGDKTQGENIETLVIPLQGEEASRFQSEQPMNENPEMLG